MGELSQKHLTDPNFGLPPDKQNPIMQSLGEPHVTSFDFMLKEGLSLAVADLDPVEFKLNEDTKIILKIEDASISAPRVPFGTVGVKESSIFPSECRQRAATYKGKLNVTVGWECNGRHHTFEKDLGDVPIMLKSEKCHLKGMTPEKLVKHGEHEQEWGGYFVVKGHERMIRMLINMRRNYPLTIRRSTWKMRGNLFSDCGVQIRCVAQDQTATNNVLHYVTDGSAKLMFSYRKTLFYIPVMLILQCLCDYPDVYVYNRLTKGLNDPSYSDCILHMLRKLKEEGLMDQSDCKSYLGKMFRSKFYDCPEWYTNEQVADYLIKKCILIHLDTQIDKFNLLVYMIQKLFYFVQDKCGVEGADSVMMQEVLLGGHLYLQIVKEKLQMWLQSYKAVILKRIKNNTYDVTPQSMVTAAKYTIKIGNILEFFLATGNITSNTGLGLMQDKGLTILAENINRMRYMSHFRAVHRGSFFQEMRTTEARQLLPDAWGFICPVHTPDGAPCGLLNHLTLNCKVTDVPDRKLVADLPRVLTELGMLSLDDIIPSDFSNSYIVHLDGRVMGQLRHEKAEKFVKKLRVLKIRGKEVPAMMEIAFVRMKKHTPQFPGLYLFTGPARLMRPVLHIAEREIEYIGTFEQIYLDICVRADEVYEGVTTHMELSPLDFLSNLGQLIPMPDCNQSPRNMYQCQMGKQTMGTPCHNWSLQAETKMYRLQTPASPLFRPKHYDDLGLDEFAMGTNAIVAVISYTGYDMEDAIVINKASDERGLFHGSIYKSEFIEMKNPTSYFCRDPTKPELEEYLDTDGLPFVGRKIEYGEPLCCFFDTDAVQYRVKKFVGKEVCYVDNVKLCGSLEKSNKLACIVYRVPRNTDVGDKFASRAGQKGICSQKWPMEDLPFTETGLVPDIIFNPHGFPSRMTVAMMIEILAGKSAACHGVVHDATPFKFNEENTAIDYFGKHLELAGFNYHGTETMYSGINGTELEADIFMGVVHYQRLRHMVSDKWQVRSTGPIDILTRQPLKGRKKGGGVRFGEMERDSLISHGAAFLLQDRLVECSDGMSAYICTACKTILGPVSEQTKLSSKSVTLEVRNTCRLCEDPNHIAKIEIPYIFKYLVTELAAFNIKLQIDCKNL